jgi:hypothetical protein
MHTYSPPAICERCGAKGLATLHFLCIECSRSQGRCPHCGGKVPPKSPEAKRETPPKEEAPKEIPNEAPKEPPKEQPKEPPKEPPKEEPKADAPRDPKRLAVDAVDLSGGERQSHSVIVFAAQSDRARLALEAHRSHKEKVTAELSVTKAGAGAGLYLVWGDFPEPPLKESDVRAAYDAKSGLIQVTLPQWPRYRPKEGIGMDWGVNRKRDWKFVAFRVRLDTLPAGDYSFEVQEIEAKDKEPRSLSSGQFTLAR